ncbi:MAG: hypothetical protein VX899_02755 [Myxococcota bacterium]|nr:hypothetical protein [Myxococcota bacterium]
MKRLEDQDWWQELLSVKDEMSLRELAARFGSTPGSINKALKRNGIERKHAPSGPRNSRSSEDSAPSDASESANAVEGTEASAPVTEAAPKAPKAPKKKKAKAAKKSKKKGATGLRAGTAAKLEPYMDQLGEVADAEVASLAGVSVQTVARIRKAKGIKPRRGRKASKSANTPRRRPGRPSKITPFEHLLGQVPDEEVAKKAKVSLNAVRNYRRRHGLGSETRAAAPAAPPVAKTPVTETPVAEAPVKAAAPAVELAESVAESITPAKAPGKTSEANPNVAAALSGQRAYRVKVGDRTAIVVGSNLVEAARKAVESGSEVSSIELLGEILA